MTEENAHRMLLSRGWLASQPPEFQQAVLARCALRIWQDGETIYALGEPADGIYGLASGNLTVLIAPNRPGPFFAHVARPGFWVGEAAHITNSPRRVEIIARGRVTMLHLPPRALTELLADDGQAAWRIAAITVSHLDLAIGVVANLMLRDPTRRVASFLLTLTGWNCAPSPPWDDIEITQSELADMCLLSRKTVVNVIDDLQRRGAIRHGYKTLAIADRKVLSAITARE